MLLGLHTRNIPSRTRPPKKRCPAGMESWPISFYSSSIVVGRGRASASTEIIADDARSEAARKRLNGLLSIHWPRIGRPEMGTRIYDLVPVA